MRSIRVRVSREATSSLAISYVIEGNISRVRVPAVSSPRFIDGLWKHTCCECFIAVDSEAEYREFNFSPSREWAAYGFADYRNGGPLNDDALKPRIAVITSADRIKLEASLALDGLPSRYTRRMLMLGLSAVIEDADGVYSFWALRHPKEKPDFHDRASFVMAVAQVGARDEVRN